LIKPIFDTRFHERGLHNFQDNLTQPRHRWYPFKEGFSSELVDQAMSAVLERDDRKLKILDPFCGSGTTPVTAALKGHETHAIEVNPFCAFTARVKCLPGKWRERPFLNHLDTLLVKAKGDLRETVLESQSTFSEGRVQEKWLFNRSVLRAFDAVWRNAPVTGNGYAPAYKLAAMRAAMECCNARKDGKALRYLKDWKKQAFTADLFFEKFRAAAIQFKEDTTLARIAPETRLAICKGDARKVLADLPIASFDLMVTSPPYLNSFDYSDVYRPELFLGGFVRDNLELRRIRLRTLRSHIQVKWGGETTVKSVLLQEPLEKLRASDSLWNSRLPEMVEAYFHDMRRVLHESARLLKPKAEAWIVVSTSAYAGVHIPVDLILADLAGQVGFQLKGVYALRALRAAGQQQKHFATDGLALRESLIVLTRNSLSII